MCFGFGRLRLSPSAFWAMTPIELAAAARAFAPAGATPLRQSELAALIALHPDQPRGQTDG